MSLELLTVDQMSRADAAAIQAGTPGFDLMQAAGLAIARCVMRRWAPRRVFVLCGPGNNGGDGLVAAAYLRQAGWPVHVFTHGDPGAWRGDAALAARLWQSTLAADALAWSPLSEVDVDTAELVIDALFGAGLSRPLDAPTVALLARLAQRGIPVVAVDVPSGVWGDSGHASGAVAADVTVTFFRRKPAHLLMPGKALCGEVMVRDIGVPEAVLPALGVQAFANEPALWRSAFPSLSDAGHKYHRGHAWVWGGGHMTGAARLSALAAARAGAGLTTVCVPPASWAIYATALRSVMVQPVAGDVESAWPEALALALGDARISAVLIGPGAAAGLEADTLRGLVLACLGSARPAVLDADALSAFAGDPATLFEAIAVHTRPVVMTPHDGEFRRLFGSDPLDAAHDKLGRARRAALMSGSVVVLKGPDTVIAAPDGRVAINHNAPPTLATAGSGDVLAGLILGLLAQGMPAWEAACAACWLHGAAAQAFGPGLIADDLPDLIPHAFRRLQNL